MRELLNVLLALSLTSALSTQGMGCWDSLCLVCAGPTAEEHLHETDQLLQLIENKPGQLKWLDKHIGVPENNIPVDIGYWNLEGGFTYPGQQHKSLNASKRFHPAPTYFKRRTDKSFKGHGLTCHAVCYKFLQQKLHYTLQFQDIWPLLQREVMRHSFHHKQKASELLDSDYGGMQNYVSDVSQWR